MRRGAPLAALCSTQAVFGGSTALPSVVWQLSTCHLRATAAPDPGIKKKRSGRRGGGVGSVAACRSAAVVRAVHAARAASGE
jgi:hypothetical protein